MIDIVSRPYTKEGEEAWDRVFGIKELNKESLEFAISEMNKYTENTGEKLFIQPDKYIVVI